jgi:hypothetical protein
MHYFPLFFQCSSLVKLYLSYITLKNMKMKCILNDSIWYSTILFLYFCIPIYILRIITAFVRYTQTLTYSVFGKKHSKNQHFDWISKRFFSPIILYGYGSCFLWFYIYAQKSNKSLVSVFCKEKFIFFKNSCFKE